MRERVSNSGITRRWVFVSLFTTIVILVVASVAIIVSMRSSYQLAARQDLENKSKILVNSIPMTATTIEERVSQAVGLVENFADKDKYELMLIDNSGKIIVTSSGFAYDATEPLDDFYLAEENDDGSGWYIGRSATDEHIIAVTQIISGATGEIEALRLVSSLKNVDKRLSLNIVIVIGVCLIILAFTIMSGLYFVRSIVIPIKNVNNTAQLISKGEYDVRINAGEGDEIGELCETINDMAAGLSKADKMKNEFISSVSHELRTPLTSIKGWGETLMAIGTKDEENFRKGMRIIINETDRLSYMVEDLLDFSRLQTGVIKLSRSIIDLKNELLDSIATIEQRAARAGITFEVIAPEGRVIVEADKNRLKQVFANILDNAVKYSNPGDSVAVELDVIGRDAYVTVSDHGAGIPKDELPNVTKRFFKASNSVTGSGIGLAVVKEIMSLHGGTIDIVSETGKGTTVSLGFPTKG